MAMVTAGMIQWLQLMRVILLNGAVTIACTAATGAHLTMVKTMVIATTQTMSTTGPSTTTNTTVISTMITMVWMTCTTGTMTTETIPPTAGMTTTGMSTTATTTGTTTWTTGDGTTMSGTTIMTMIDGMAPPRTPSLSSLPPLSHMPLCEKFQRLDSPQRNQEKMFEKVIYLVGLITN